MTLKREERGSRVPLKFRLTLREASIAIGCNMRAIRPIVARLGLRPRRVESRRAVYDVGPEDLKRIAFEYYRGLSAPGKRLKRLLGLGAAERLHRWWAAENERAERARAKRRAAKAARKAKDLSERALPAPFRTEVSDLDGSAGPAVGDGPGEADIVAPADAAPAVATGR